MIMVKGIVKEKGITKVNSMDRFWDVKRVKSRKNSMNKTKIKTIAMMVAAVFTFSSGTLVYAESGVIANAIKEENVYVSLTNTGEVKSVYVINEFELKNPGLVIDFGNYDSIVNLTTSKKIEVKDDRITFEAEPGRFYYQGNLESAELPWDISIEWFLDGEKLSAEEIAGKSGALKIILDIRKNDRIESLFNKNYAVQTSVYLNTEKCTNIVAEGSAIANAGRNKLVNFTMLPGKEAKFTVTADVKDFEMDGIQISAVPLVMSIDGLDTSELTGQLGELADGISELDDGTQEIRDGSSKLNLGTSNLAGGITGVLEGLGSLNEGMKNLAGQGPEIVDSSAKIQFGLAAVLEGLSGAEGGIPDVAQLNIAASGLKAGMNELYSGITNLESSIKDYEQKLKDLGLEAAKIIGANQQAINSLRAAEEILKAGIAVSEQGTLEYQQLKLQLDENEKLVELLDANTALISADSSFKAQLLTGIGTLGNGADLLSTNFDKFNQGIQAMTSSADGAPSGITSLKEGLSSIYAAYGLLQAGLTEYTGGTEKISTSMQLLTTNYNEIEKGGRTIKKGIAELDSGIAELADGTAQLREETSNMETDIQEAVDEMLESYTGKAFKPISFISSNNIEVKSVQFVFKTPAVAKIAAEAQQEETQENKGFWGKLMALFAAMFN